MVDHPDEEIKKAAKMFGIKYPRATAIYRKHKRMRHFVTKINGISSDRNFAIVTFDL